MPELLVDGAEIVFEPGPGWEWVGWNGHLTLPVRAAPGDVDDHPIAVASDVMALAPQLVGKTYKATGFSDTPGSVIVAVILVNPATLSRYVTINGQPAATAQTRGTFTASCVPSMKVAVPPVPDPLCAAHVGSWNVNRPGQTRATEE